MSKISKIILIFGIVVAMVGGILLLIKSKNSSSHFEYTMATVTYDKKSGTVNPSSEKATHSKYLGMLVFMAQPDSKIMATALACVEEVANVEKVDLYMPDMGHGSQLPTVSLAEVPKNLKILASAGIGFGCLNIGSMQLFMAGLWQVRLFYKNGYVGLFNVEVN